jgi:hypothetical protein
MTELTLRDLDMVFKQSFKYFTKVSSLTIIFTLSEFFFILLYIYRAIVTQTNSKSVLREEKNHSK